MGPTLETLPTDSESPHLVTPEAVEGGGTGEGEGVGVGVGEALAPRRVSGVTVGFTAFLDGVQRSVVFGFAEGVPLIQATVAAVIRRRAGRRLVTNSGSPLIARRMYLPRARVPESLWAAAERDGYDPCDTDAGPHFIAPHPLALQERALHLVQADRERLEQQLADRWCAHEDTPLYIDGGLSTHERIATAPCAVGVVKTHRTLYVAPEGLPVIARLRAGERTTAFRVTSRHRTPVLSWYLRLRDAGAEGGRGPLWGLVRIEVADAHHDPAACAARADAVSQWVLAERAPLALPDPRWALMAYGIRDCETFLRAVV